FLGTGEIACREDGRHFRPNHAAAASRRIQEHLAGITTTENAFIARKIYPWLPSSEHTFARAEPLTRIRDIAHRNDIPQELKREIKHTLQNKLHRCAGPEDLVTSAGVLERITAPAAGYSESFVEQFKVFHEELREFFNARSLEDQLRAIAQQADAEESGLICRFLDQKENLEQGIESQLAALELLTALRRRFLVRVEKAPGSETQAFRLAEITLESFCFPLLSRMINHFDAAPIFTPSHEAGGIAPVDLTHPEADGPQTLCVAWELILNTFSLTLANVSLSGLSPEECQALESELAAWRQTSAALVREQLMR